MVPNSHMDTYACELERSYTETVGNGRMDGPNGVRSHPPTPTRLLFLKYRVRTGTRRAAPRRRDRKFAPAPGGTVLLNLVFKYGYVIGILNKIIWIAHPARSLTLQGTGLLKKHYLPST